MSRLLLDTHVLLWWFTDDKQLSATSKSAIADGANEVYASAASAWEIATKMRLGKLNDLPDAALRYGEMVATNGFTHLPISYRHALAAGGFQTDHRDPFDRMLAAQSKLEGIPLVTKDPAFSNFEADILW
ncbi:MAG: type II toxin-antitoxin system VapC family toxin [Acidimicrobiales bacterium]